jgi:hypothetical protein
MKNRKWAYYFLGLSLVVVSCQPTTAVKNDQTTTADTAFYYVQKDIDDPFLDTIFQTPDKAIHLKKEIYPLPQPKSAFLEIEGFRVQIFAGIDTLNAETARSQATTIVEDSIYLLQDKGLLKVQAGDYPYRYQADAARDRFRRGGFPGAWVILTNILIPADTTGSAADTSARADSAKTTLEQTEEGRYKIQIIATSSEEKANEVINSINNVTGYSAFYQKSANLFKVFVGPFKEETEAREALQKVRSEGYPDAWLVY